MQIMNVDKPSYSEMENQIIYETNTTVDNTQKDENLDGLLKDMKSFKEFCNSVESRLYRIASAGFVVDLLKERIVFLENELKQKDTVINFLAKKLVCRRFVIIIIIIIIIIFFYSHQKKVFPKSYLKK